MPSEMRAKSFGTFENQAPGDLKVHVGPTFQTYMGYQQAVVEKHPEYLPVAMLPCTMLWPWMAGTLIKKVDKQNPYYKDWFVPKMRPPRIPSLTEKFVDENKGAFDERIARQIFCEGMMNEVNALQEARGEPPFEIL